VSTRLVVATANVLRPLPCDEARVSLTVVLEHEPDVVGLQEWGIARWGLLRETGVMRTVPGPRKGAPREGYLWCAPVYGGCPVGVRAERFDVVDARLSVLSRPGRADSPRRPFGLEPARVASVVRLVDRVSGNRTSVVCFHLVPGVQRGGHYRTDRPLLVARHRHEVGALQRAVDDERERTDDVYALGDSNFDGLRLRGLVSAWKDRDRPGTLKHRTIDDVFGPGPAAEVTLVTTGSDHRAVVVTT
jgi:hypothetical protein